MVNRHAGIPVSTPFESVFEDRTDKISLTGAENFKKLEVSSGGKGVAIINWNGELLTLWDVENHNINADDFIFG